MLASSAAAVVWASAAMLAGGGVEDWLKTGNIPTTIAMQIEVHCLQNRSARRVQEVENAGQDPRGAEDCFYQGVPVGMCHLESRAADARQKLADKQGHRQRARQASAKLSSALKKSSTWASRA